MKAFLCHSSTDKEYVRIVARRLSRARAMYDEMCFLPGVDFRDSIIKGLDSSDLFVFFVSRESLKSIWCRFELGEAERRINTKSLRGALAIIIDKSINYNQLPKWMRPSKAIVQPRPVLAAREIQSSLLSVFKPELKKPFVGRESTLGRFAASLIENVPDASSRIFCIYGLDGIGRRTFLSRALEDNLSLRLGPSVIIDSTRSLDDIYLWALDETEDLVSRKKIAEKMLEFNDLDEKNKYIKIADQLKIICESSFVPCLIDEGGILTDEGWYLDKYISLMGEFMRYDDANIAFIHKRHPRLQDLQARFALTEVSVNPIDPDSMRLLIHQIFRPLNIRMSSAGVDELIDYLDGYPPAAYMSAGYAEKYGFESLLADKSILQEFKARVFARYISELKLSEQGWAILQYLAGEQSLPLNVLSVALAIDVSSLVPIMRELIDLSLIVMHEDSFAISKPVRTAVQRARGLIRKEEYERMASDLTQRFWSGNDASPTIEVVDATLHAVARSGSIDFEPYTDLVRPSIVHRMAKEAYDRKQWGIALTYAERTIRMDPTRSEARVIQFKALVRLEEWPRAEAVLKEIADTGDRIEFYLRGFLAWKRRRYTEAIEHFQSALDAGHQASAVYRDYAECLYRIGQYDRALDKIRVVQGRDPGNVFILDLICRICIDGKKFDQAEEYLKQLDRADVDKRFIYHRKSRFYSEKKMLDLALSEAEKACQAGIAAFEAYAQKADILIDMENYGEAFTLVEDIKKQFGGQRADVQIGLKCKIQIRKRRWREALAIWRTLREQGLPVHQAMLKRILTLKSEDQSLTNEERETAANEASAILIDLPVAGIDTVFENED